MTLGGGSTYLRENLKAPVNSFSGLNPNDVKKGKKNLSILIPENTLKTIEVGWCKVKPALNAQ
jgi:hypothetical protein